MNSTIRSDSAPSEPIHIGFVLHSMHVAGAEVLVAVTIRRLGPRLQPVVLCLDGVGQLGEQMNAEGIPVVALGRRPGVDLRVAHRLAREIRTRRLEVLHAHQYTPFFYTALARLLVWRPIHVMFTEHGRHYPDIVSARRRLVNRFALSHLATEINAVCGFSARSLADVDGFSGRPINIIENGIDVERYQVGGDRAALRERLGLDSSRRYIACVARFHPVKNHQMLIDAFAEVAARFDDVDLLLAGDGPLRFDLENQARRLRIDARVRFLGIRTDVPEILRASDVFALTSLSEAASLTLLEAMASGLPVVVTNVGGNPEIVRHDLDGLLVPRGDETAAAAALAALLADPGRSRTMGESGRRRVSTQYRLDETVRRYYERYAAASEVIRRGVVRH